MGRVWMRCGRCLPPRRSPGAGRRGPLAGSGIAAVVAPSSSISMARARQPASAPCRRGPPYLPPPQRRLDAMCAPGYKGRRGEVVRTRTTVLQIHTRQWVGTFGGKGNGDYRGELATAQQVVGTYLDTWDLPHKAGIIRADGIYGDPAVLAQIVRAGFHELGRGKGYALLDHPHMQAVLAQTAPVTITTPESQVTYEASALELGRTFGAQRPCPAAAGNHARLRRLPCPHRGAQRGGRMSHAVSGSEHAGRLQQGSPTSSL